MKYALFTFHNVYVKSPGEHTVGATLSMFRFDSYDCVTRTEIPTNYVGISVGIEARGHDAPTSSSTSVH